MTKKEKLKEIELAKQREIDLINEYNRMIEQTEAEKAEIKANILKLCGDKYYCGVRIQKEQTHDIIENLMSGVNAVKMDFELYEIDNEVENGTV